MSRDASGARWRARCIAGVLLALALAGLAQAQKEPPTPAALAAQARENQLLQLQLDLASGKDFYLLLDARSRSLRVMLQGVTLRDYQIRELEMGVPRVLFRRTEPPAGWFDRSWSDPQLVPPRARDRLEIVATGDSTTMPEPPVPLTPEEAFPAPPNYRIRYAGGLALDVRSETPPAMLPDSLKEDTSLMGRLRAWVMEARSVLIQDERDLLRVRVVLRTEDAAALYRSMPPGTKLLVLVHAAGS